MSKRNLGILALVGSMLFWGPGPVVIKLGLTEVPPYSLAFLRLFLAWLIVLPFFFFNEHHKKIARKDLPLFLLMGIFGSGLNVLFFMSGIIRTTANSSAAIFAAVPLVNAVAAGIILREKETPVRIIGVVIGFFGSLLIAFAPIISGKTGSESGDIIGNFFIVGAVLSWVTYIIGSRGLLLKYSPLTLTTFSFFMGACCLFPLALNEFLNNPNWIFDVHFKGWFAIFYATIFSSVVPYSLYNWGLKQTSAFLAGLVNYLNPVMASIAAAIVLKEQPTLIFLGGTTLIFLGVFLATLYESLKKKNTD